MPGEQKEKDSAYIIDYISGLRVKDTPEEREAVQIFSKQLVEDYEYPPSFIQTRPQYRVRVRPSDTKKEYPVDIAVFQDAEHSEESAYIVVECKKKHRKDGIDQLKDYLRFSRAYLGVWFNGDERIFLRKTEKDGRVLFEEIPNLPKYGQRVEDIGLFLRKDLKPTHNLKAIFKSIRNYLAANTVGATRDEELARQLINIIFCKIYDEKFTALETPVRFRAGIQEEPKEVLERIQLLFEDVKERYGEVISAQDEITLDEKSLVYVVGELQYFSLMQTERDVVGDAFEVFIGHALKGAQGQFFTPRNVIRMMVAVLQPSPSDKVIDPACGTGGFLIDSLRHVWQEVSRSGVGYGWSDSDIEKEKSRVASDNFRGIDKDYFLSKVTKAYMAIIGDGQGGIFCEDSLEEPAEWKSETQSKIALGQFDIILTNPPFGSKIPVRGAKKLKQFTLAHKWKKDKETASWVQGSLKESEAPQILFIERCIDLLKDGGRMGIVLPDGILGNDKLGYIRDYLLRKGEVYAIIDVPVETFMPNTSTKTSVLFFRKTDKPRENYNVFMAIAESCGHDRRGNPRDDDDIARISDSFMKWKAENAD